VTGPFLRAIAKKRVHPEDFSQAIVTRVPASGVFVRSRGTGSGLYPELGKRLLYFCVDYSATASLASKQKTGPPAHPLSPRAPIPAVGNREWTAPDEAEIRKGNRLRGRSSGLPRCQNLGAGRGFRTLPGRWWRGQCPLGSAYRDSKLLLPLTRELRIGEPKVIEGVHGKFLVGNSEDGQPTCARAIRRVLGASQGLGFPRESRRTRPLTTAARKVRILRDAEPRVRPSSWFSQGRRIASATFRRPGTRGLRSDSEGRGTSKAPRHDSCEMANTGGSDDRDLCNKPFRRRESFAKEG